jgi:PEGA domain
VTRSNTLALACALVGVALLWPADAHAQHRRVVRSGGGRSVVVVGGYFYRPWFYDPWYGWGYPYGWYPPYAYGGRYVDSSLRLHVEPKETEVFIDGYYAGTVDDFDGFFQRLRLEPGEHDVQLYLAGHRTMRQKVYLQPTGTFRIRHTMQPLGAGETPDPRPDPPARPPQPTRPYDPAGGRERVERPDPPGRSGRDSEFGAVAIRVQPEEAEVLVDGERWDGPDGSDRLVIQLAEGEHRIEVRREGFSTYSSTVRVRRGETTALNVSLVRE